MGSRLLATLQPDGNSEAVKYHHPDRLGTRIITNATDSSVVEQVTLPFGTALDSESSAAAATTNRRFTSYDRSAKTGLDYAVNRHYDSQQGRFTQVDPIGMGAVSLTNPQSLNLYAYCGNDPVNRIDPNGLFWSKLFKWIGKILKWVGIVALVVMTVIWIAPASSFIFKAALWIFGHILLPLSQVPVLGAAVPLGSLGSPPWNPNSRSLFGNSFQDQGSTCPPDCQDQIFLPPVSAGTIYANYSTWEKIWRGVNIGLDKALTSVVGFDDFITWGGSKWLTKKVASAAAGQDLSKDVDREYAERQSSWFYTGGEALGLAWDIATGEELAVAGSKLLGWGGRFAIHTAHHPFWRFGRLSHLQLNVFKVGVKGSGKTVFRIPLFVRRWPKRGIIIRRW